MLQTPMTQPQSPPQNAARAQDHAESDSAPVPTNLASAIRPQQVRLIYTQSRLAVIAIFPISLLLAYLLWDVIDHRPLLAWTAIALIISCARLILVEAFLRLAPPDEAIPLWERRFFLASVMGGATWALAGVLLFFTSSIPHQVLIIFIVAGVISGSIGTLNSMFSIYRALALTAAVPNIIIQFLFLDIFHSTIGVMLSIYTLMMFRAAKNMNASYMRSLTLGFENAELVQTLSSANTSMKDANRNLHEEIREKIAIQQALRTEKERAQVTLESIGDGVITTDVAGKIDYLNAVAKQLCGCSLARARGRAVNEVLLFVDEQSRDPIPDALELHYSHDRSADGPRDILLVNLAQDKEYSIEITQSPILDFQGEQIGTVFVLHDVTEIRSLAKQMSYQARHDALTGLFNRREFEAQLGIALMSARTDGKHHALMYLDLDQFKVVNDTCGHVAGDEFLKQLTPRLVDVVRENDVLARLGGDEFGLLLNGCDLENARAVANKLSEAVQSFRFIWQERSFDVGVSIGLVPVTAEISQTAELMSAADAACYAAKDEGRNRVHVYLPNDETIAQRHGEMQWVHKIKQALIEDRFQLYFQPAVPLTSNGHYGVYCEFLLRLIDEHGTLISPMTFIPAAERYQLMPTIDRWVVETALNSVALKDPAMAGYDIFAINLSGQSLSDECFLDFVLTELADRNIEPERICFEITETAAIANFQKASRFISRLRGMGCRFALDDFGSGLSSFAYLKTLAVDFIKIDGAFVKDMVTDPLDRAMVQAIQQIGHVMGKTTIAEFVEDDAILSQLRELGVDYAQGYGVARPQPLTVTSVTTGSAQIPARN